MDTVFSKKKVIHSLHCCFLLTAIYKVIWMTWINDKENSPEYTDKGKYILYFICNFINFTFLLLRILETLLLFIGLICFNAFIHEVEIKPSRSSIPFLCFRIVTQGNYPQLVKNSAFHNLKICFDVGLKDFIIEVVTNKPLCLPSHKNIKQIIVPESYVTKSGAIYKGRNLQYCLDNNINAIKENDWIVHLDEETLITEHSLKGIVNFVRNEKYPIGQGYFSGLKHTVPNWLTLFLDSYVLTYFIALTCFIIKIFHIPQMGIKGSFLVVKYAVECDVGFDHGPESMSEDLFFGANAFIKGYQFGFIQGEMLEHSTLTLEDHIKQYAKWMTGRWFFINSKVLPLKCKVWYMLRVYNFIFNPFLILNIALMIIFEIPTWATVSVMKNLTIFVTCYAFIYPILIYYCAPECSFLKFCLLLILSICVIPLEICCFCFTAIYFLYSFLYNKNNLFKTTPKLG